MLNLFENEKSASGDGDAKPMNPYSMQNLLILTPCHSWCLPLCTSLIFWELRRQSLVVDAYFEAPERVAALILVAPAIVAPLIVNREAVKGTQLGGDNQIQEDSSSSNSLGKPFVQLFNILSKFAKFVSQAIMKIVKGMANMLNSLYKKLLSAILRSAISVMLVWLIIDEFGIAAVKNAWHDSNLVTEHVPQGYAKPLRTKNWERALVENTAAMLADTTPESDPPLSKGLHEISCPSNKGHNFSLALSSDVLNEQFFQVLSWYLLICDPKSPLQRHSAAALKRRHRGTTILTCISIPENECHGT